MILHVVVGFLVFVVQLWGEIPPWELVFVSKEGCRVMEVKDDSEGIVLKGVL